MKTGMILVVKSDTASPRCLEKRIKDKLDKELGPTFNLSVLVVSREDEVSILPMQST